MEFWKQPKVIENQYNVFLVSTIDRKRKVSVPSSSGMFYNKGPGSPNKYKKIFIYKTN